MSTTISKYVEVKVDVDVELSDFESNDLIKELRDRKIEVPDSITVEKLYNAYVLKQHDRVDELLRELFYETIGRII